MNPAPESNADLTLTGLPPAGQRAPYSNCPVDRLPRRRRNQVCVLCIALGLLNFLAYAISYAVLGGDAHNGHRAVVETDTGARSVEYFVRGHFIRHIDGRPSQVSRNVWIYSYLHSISVLLTSGGMIISMLVLARPHIIATMRNGVVRGPVFVFVFGLFVAVVTLAASAAFVWDFIAQLNLD